tara:strand:- start:544 stop:1212 length:669 start_codon:yes stop_codon:yes gene_type:complete
MKKIILQHWTGELGELENLSSANIQKYAKFCGADYKLLRGSVFNRGVSTQSQKMHMLSEEFDDYDVVVMMDIDMFVRKGCTANIFTDETGMGRHYNIQETLVKKLAAKWPLLCNADYPYWGGSCYRLEKDIRQEFRKHLHIHEMIQFNGTYNDEGIMHRCAVLADFKVKPGIYFDRQQWNYSSFEETVDEAYIIHIRPKVKLGGPKAPKIENYRALVKRNLI